MKNFLLFVFLFAGLLVNAQIIYNADFSNEGDGFPDHTTAIPPASAPASANGGTAPNNWITSYTAIPSTDGTANEFSVNSGVLRIQDWGDTDGTFQSASIDVSGSAEVDISAIGATIGSAVQNGGSEFFEYFYILDGGTEVSTNISVSSGPVNYSVTGLDVSTNNSLVVGFRFQVNGAGDGYEISSFSVTQTVLPIELTSFSVTPKEKSTQINWITSSEINNDYMAIERSTDSKKFQEIGTVEGAGTTNDRKEYSFIDEAPVNGMNYYRLRQVDYDGTISYSEVVSVEFVRDETIISIYPNPTTDALTIKFPENWEGKTVITILNGLGQVVKVINTPTETFSVGDLPVGMYNLRVTNGRQSVSKFFVKG